MIKRILILPFAILLLLAFAYTYFKIGQFLPSQEISVFLLTLLLFVAIIGWELIYRCDSSLANKRWFRTLAWVGSTLLGVWVTFILFSLMIDVDRLAFLAITTLTHTEILNHTPSAPLFQWISIAILVISLLIAGLGLKTALSEPKIIEVFIPTQDKLSALRAMKIVQISDLHVGVMIRRSYVEKIVQRVNGLKPDLIVLTGDIADGAPDNLTDQLQPLAKLCAPFGKFYVTGNHEYYWGADKWVEKMRELGITPLINENRIVSFADIKVLIAGITDISSDNFLPSHKSDVHKAIHSDDKTDFAILLSHNPRAIGNAEKAGFNLQLSGHTHSGQFFPFNFLIFLAHKYHTGLNQHNKTWLYVNSGTGSWGPQNRCGVNSEITVIGFKN